MLFLIQLLISLTHGGQSDRETQYLELAQATLQNPVSTAELRTAVLSPHGVEAIRSLFERSMAESLNFEDRMVTPELGGEAMLTEGRLELVLYPDPVHTAIRELVALGNRPREMLSYLEGTSEGRRLLENTGGLHALLYRLASESALSAKDLELLETIIANTVATYFKTWTTEPSIQVRMIEQTDWRGRYVGFWHIHPPRETGAGFQEGIEPSVADMRNAVELGQFLTIVFQPNGFDFYDLSRLAFLRREDLSEVERISYRSENWEPHFLSRLRVAQGASTP
ncbi:MAG: hypothetical protein E2P02_20270 [Acidobacteria bacterium]|nr:MAG: hypothetical protein E2P02_20270 [Acidobacteriota bacterium]